LVPTIRSYPPPPEEETWSLAPGDIVPIPVLPVGSIVNLTFVFDVFREVKSAIWKESLLTPKEKVFEGASNYI